MDSLKKRPRSPRTVESDYVEITLRVSTHASPRVFAAVCAVGGGKNGAALVRQLAEEALILRELRKGSLDQSAPSSEPSRHPVASLQKSTATSGRLDKVELAAALDQF